MCVSTVRDKQFIGQGCNSVVYKCHVSGETFALKEPRSPASRKACLSPQGRKHPQILRPISALCLYLRPQLRHAAKSKGKGGRPARGRVPRRTCKRSNYCGFTEVMGLFRAELYRRNIALGELNMTAWSFQTSLTKWEPLTRPGS